MIDENENIFDRTDNWTSFADGDALPFLLQGEIFSSPSVIYRRSALKKFEWNENAKLEDYEMYLKLTTEGEFARSDKILSAWRCSWLEYKRRICRRFFPNLSPHKIVSQIN